MAAELSSSVPGAPAWREIVVRRLSLDPHARFALRILALAVPIAALLRLLVSDVPPLPSLCVVTVLALAFSFATYRAAVPSLGVFIRTLMVITAGYLVACYPYFIVDGGAGGTHHLDATAINTFFWIMLAFAVAGLFRPSFALLPFAFLISLKSTLSATSGLPISQTDYAIVPELGLFLVVGIVLVAMQSGQQWGRPTKTAGASGIETKAAGMAVVFAALAVHFSNYFYAGLGKLTLDGPPLAWVSNRTTYIMLASIAERSNPLIPFPQVMDAVFYWFDRAYILTNIVVLVFQLACVFVLTRPALIILFLTFFDLMHVTIFVSSGIFFWKWILLNLLLIVLIKRFEFPKPPAWLWVTGVLLTLAGPAFFSVPKLAWYNTPELNSVGIRAVVDDGSKVDLPSNFFGNYSISFAQDRTGRAVGPHLPISSLGSTQDYDIATEAETCGSPLLPASTAPQDLAQLSDLRAFVAGYHRFAIARTDAAGRLPYDLFPHHIWSTPAAYPEAAALDLRRVIGYELVLRSSCITDIRAATGFNELVKAETLVPIALQR